MIFKDTKYIYQMSENDIAKKYITKNKGNYQKAIEDLESYISSVKNNSKIIKSHMWKLKYALYLIKSKIKDEENSKIIYLSKSLNPSLNAVWAFKDGKYFASQMKLMNKISGVARKGSKPYKEYKEDLQKALVKSDDERSINGNEWHHINKSGYSFMVDLNILKKLGYKFIGNPNKELKI